MPSEAAFVSTGHLPEPTEVQLLVEAAHTAQRDNAAGANSSVYPALTTVDSRLFGISVAAVSGRLYEAGDATTEFPIMSVVKPFVFALVCEAIGPAAARARLGVNATGLPFNSVEAIERFGGVTNPMVNPGAIAAIGLVPGTSSEQRWERIQTEISQFAGRRLEVTEEVYLSASATNLRNRAITQLLVSYGTIYGDPGETLDLYTRACSLGVSARDLAVMGATLADGA